VAHTAQMSLDLAGKWVSFLSCINNLLPSGEDGRQGEDNNSDPSVPRGVVDVVKNWLAEWQLTQHAHKERARVRDAQVAKTAKTDLFKQTCWLNYCQPESDAARTPDSAARLRRGDAAAGGEADGAAGGGAG
jgi:hypothetical protein